MFKKTVLSILALPAVAFAQQYGVVVDVKPAYDQVYVPTVVCHKSINAPGLVLGGLLGSRFGGGTGQDIMTIVGAIAGANHGNTQNCQSYETLQPQFAGYNVVVNTNGYHQTFRYPNVIPLGTWVRVH